MKFKSHAARKQHSFILHTRRTHTRPIKYTDILGPKIALVRRDIAEKDQGISNYYYCEYI